MPTAISHLQLRSSSAHCDLPLAATCWRGGGGGGNGEEAAETERRRKTRRRGGEALIKSNHPHLAGGKRTTVKHETK